MAVATSGCPLVPVSHRRRSTRYRRRLQQDRSRRPNVTDMAWRPFVLSCIVGGFILASCSTSTTEPAHTTAPTPISQVSRCTASDLEATGGRQGATQTMLGSLAFTNDSRSPCTLRGFIKVALVDRNGQIVKERTEHGVTPALCCVTNDVRTVVLRPRKSNRAVVPLQFSCQGPVPIVRTVRVFLADRSSLDVQPDADPWTVESCQPGSGPSVLSEDPVQYQPA